VAAHGQDELGAQGFHVAACSLPRGWLKCVVDVKDLLPAFAQPADMDVNDLRLTDVLSAPHLFELIRSPTSPTHNLMPARVAGQMLLAPIPAAGW